MYKLTPRFVLAAIFLLFVILALACNFSPANLLPGKTTGLQLEPRAADGSVSGSYQASDETAVQFSVTADGLATFRLEDAQDSETLIVNSKPDQLPHLIWQGQDVDGLGALNSEEQAALDDVLKGNLANSLALIPLDIACQGLDAVTPAQVAALLFPLQMRFKYQTGNRSALAAELTTLTRCDYGFVEDENEEEETPGSHPTVILMTPADPVPVVLGYFPFDELGAVEPAQTSTGVLMAPVDQVLRAQFPQVPSINPFGPDPIQDEWGPCEAKCRGACGPDCTHNNCKFYIDDRCEKNMGGENDGTASLVKVYECGTHPACIEHDACYDDCNRRHGCGTFAAAVCRHAGVLDPSTAMAALFGLNISCDRKVLNTYPYGDVEDWTLGYGPQPNMQTYEYHIPEYRYVEDPINCPRPDQLQEEPSPEEAPSISNIPEGAFPAGQYKGETGLAPGLNAGQLLKDEFVITLGEDGNLSGSLIVEYLTLSYSDEDNNCTRQYHFAFTGSFSGQLTSNTATFEIINVPTICEKMGSCSGSVECESGDSAQVFIEVDDEKIVGHWIDEEFPEYNPTFTLIKQ